MLHRLRTGLSNSAHCASARADALLRRTTLRLAVTGLSRAGKTVFATSLLANLLALEGNPRALPALRRRLGVNGAEDDEAPTRLRSVRLVPPGSAETPPFDLARHLAALTAETPGWPARTDDLSETAIELTFEHGGFFKRRLGSHRLRIELLDYPGEWLLDLPMLDQSFAAWSRETLARLRQGARAVAFARFLEHLPTAEPNQRPDDAHLRRLHVFYRDGMRAAQSEHGLRLLQPGRFLCPGPRADAPFLWFFPLSEAPDRPRRGTVAALLQERFEAYKADMRMRFFERHFARFDRQVVLADVLGALHSGREAFGDTQKALALIAGSLSYGGWNLGRSKQGRIARVAFAATKADHVPLGQRTNLRHLLEDLVKDASAPVAKDAVTFHAVASVNCTKDDTVEVDGLTRDVVRGTPVGAGTPKLFDPGHVPAGRPPDSFWDRPRFVLPVFEPPRDKTIGPRGIPNLGLDAILVDLLGDKL